MLASRPRFTIRWLMIRIAILAPIFALLASAERDSRASRCGTSIVSAILLLMIMTVVYMLARLLIWATRHPS
ncbi:MAG TPA: hypothetical protein VG406_03920 [Isosphaeraceae bacterium]|nr:hypothetical protein [Isosphaeraceae bacterium]